MASAVNPYLVFNGNCSEAFDHYKAVFGGEFDARMTFADGPADMNCGDQNNGQENGGGKISEDEMGKILHVSLGIGNSTLMGSDCPSSQPPVNFGDNIAVNILTESEEEADKIFAGLSEGGKVFMPMDKTFWGAYFGMVVDKFGIMWQVNYAYPQS